MRSQSGNITEVNVYAHVESHCGQTMVQRLAESKDVIWSWDPSSGMASVPCLQTRKILVQHDYNIESLCHTD